MQYRDLFNDAPVMYVVTRYKNGIPHVEDCNDLFCQTLGYNSDQVLKRPLSDFYTADSRKRLLQVGSNPARKGRFGSEECRLLAVDGRPVETLIRSMPVYSESEEKIIGSRAIYVDVTERKRADRSASGTSLRSSRSTSSSIDPRRSPPGSGSR